MSFPLHSLGQNFTKRDSESNGPGMLLPQNKIQILLVRRLSVNWVAGSAGCNQKLILQRWFTGTADVAFEKLIFIYKVSTTVLEVQITEEHDCLHKKTYHPENDMDG